MFAIGPIGFTAPLILLTLVALPILWLLLRAVPPAPIRRRFPGVALLLGLQDAENETDKTPWWLLLLRTLAIAAAIVGLAGPILNPEPESDGTGPLLIVMDGTWSDAADWSSRIERIEALLDEAARTNRVVAVATLTGDAPQTTGFQAPNDVARRLPGLAPQPWLPDDAAINAFRAGLPEGDFDTFWLSDGIAHSWRETLLDEFSARGTVSVFESSRPVLGLKSPVFEDGLVKLTAVRSRSGSVQDLTINARGLDPSGVERILAEGRVTFLEDDFTAELELSLPAELRNRISRFEIAGLRSAGAVSLTDDGLRRREIAMFSGSQNREGLRLLAPTHFLEQALQPSADIIEGALPDILLANPDVIILADIATLADGEAEGVLDWVKSGGMLLRFAGPRLAASDISRTTEDPLMPVRLRAGGRSVGGTLSWGEPQSLRAFSETSPFFGLAVPDEVTVSAQVVAQPDPFLSERVIAALSDGTPLITRKRIDDGQVVLFHVTANAEWSSLPLSGLFVQMLDRLAVSSRAESRTAESLVGTRWTPDQVLDGFGQIRDADALPGIAGERLVNAQPSADIPPGLYAGEDQRIALNVIGNDQELLPTQWPDSVPVEGFSTPPEQNLKGFLLSAALGLLLVDIIASLWIAGRLVGPRTGMAALLALAMLSWPAEHAAAQEDISDEFALIATADVVLAHILTGDARVDEIAMAGLRGLSRTLVERTSIEPAEPLGIDLETDELAFFPFIYWPVTQEQPLPSVEAYAKLNQYLRTGGMILFDTRDSDVARFGGTSTNGRKLQQLAGSLDVPPLEPIPTDHVLTRTFYLIQDFPGRHISRDVWVEASRPDAELVEGMPFRNLNDSVTPIVIGGNDWAAAWAIDAQGTRMFPVGRGFAGERQREVALRFGVNLIMHVLTGNYKSDQVHVPALLERLGQ